MDSKELLLTNLTEIEQAASYVSASPLVRSTPLFSGFKIPAPFDEEGKEIPIFLKMESLQFTGSFKIRGMINCFRENEAQVREYGCVTLSAGMS